MSRQYRQTFKPVSQSDHQFLGLGFSEEDWIDQIEFSPGTSNDFS